MSAQPSRTALTPLITRSVAVTALVLTALSWGAASQAAEAVAPSASIGEVTCVEGDGTVNLTLIAGDSDASFDLYVDGEYVGDDSVTVAAGQTQVVPADGLDDDDHTFEIDLAGGDGDEGADPTELASATRTVECDPAPTGAYANAKGSFDADCDTGDLKVAASNKPKGGNTADLQPVTFELSFAAFDTTDDSTDDSTDGTEDGTGGGEDPSEPGDEDGTDEDGRSADDPTDEGDPTDDGTGLLDPVVLDTFTLDAGTPTYARSLSYSEVGGAGLVVLKADGTEIASTYYYGGCMVAVPVADSGTAGAAGGAGVAGTGA